MTGPQNAPRPHAQTHGAPGGVGGFLNRRRYNTTVTIMLILSMGATTLTIPFWMA